MSNRWSGRSVLSKPCALALASALLVGVSFAQTAVAASEAEIQHMDGLALLLGRAIGCDLNTERAAGEIAAWLDQTFPPGSVAQQRYLGLFAEAVRSYARQQRSGNSPDSCVEVADALARLGWFIQRTGVSRPVNRARSW